LVISAKPTGSSAVPLTTRNWNTITAIAAALNRGQE
jgi:hypothetical protein